MPKRIATSELNHDNWNEEEAPEEAGTFQKAAPDVIEKRVIRNARRRVVGGSGSGSAQSVFAGFQGFGKTTENPAVFNFLKKSNATSENTGVQSKIEPSSHTPMFKQPVKEVPVSEQDPLQPSPPFTVSYLGAIKKLNECFIKHIQTCFEEKQFIILSPCFRDYEQHLKSILPLNDSNNKGEGENKVLQENTEPSSKKEDHEDETSSNVFSAKKTNFSSSANAEVTPGSGFKFFVSDGSKSLPNSNAVTLGTIPPLSASAKKQFPWSGGWGSNSPNQLVTSEPTNESPKGESAGASEEPTDESDVPPKVEFKQVVEDGAIYSRRCKVFVKTDANYHDHGVGMLFLKPVESGKKTQLIVRADTSLGNLLLNTLLSADMTMQRMGNNNVMLICLPTPEFKTDKPLPVLLRVKTSEDADELLQKLKEFKK
ncbi:hypothetical protein R5R35_010592 [Gryllus longicercus]|uniref:RanBD1 domain-containing protein n=1 Tax=Gryllus longicercus TaxID=2509291 RepID=A0AAN9VN97_9ORTH